METQKHTSSDSDETYDSEEERVLERIQLSRRHHTLQQERMRQAALLRVFRAEQHARQRLEQDVYYTRLRKESLVQEQYPASLNSLSTPGRRTVPDRIQDHEQRWALLEQSSQRAGFALSCADIPWPPTDCPTQYLRDLAQQDMLQQTQQAHRQTAPEMRDCGLHPAQAGQQRDRASDGVSPHPHTCDHHCYPGGGRQRPPSQQQHDPSPPTPACAGSVACSRVWRRAYAKACLRWHPDKFQSRWGGYLEAGEREGVMAKVQTIAQGINRAWEEVQGE